MYPSGFCKCVSICHWRMYFINVVISCNQHHCYYYCCYFYKDILLFLLFITLCLMQKIQEQRVMRLLPRTTCQNLTTCCIPEPLDSPLSWTDYEKVSCDPHQQFLKLCYVYIKHGSGLLINLPKILWMVGSQTANMYNVLTHLHFSIIWLQGK